MRLHNGFHLAAALLLLLCRRDAIASRHPQVIDEDPAHWARLAFIAGDKAVTLAIPHGYVYEKGDPRPHRPIDLEAPETSLVYAGYDPGYGVDADIWAFVLSAALYKYVTPQTSTDLDMQSFTRTLEDAMIAATRGAPLRMPPTTEVTLGGRRWLHFGSTFATQLSTTHCLVISASVFAPPSHDPKWAAARRRLLEAVVNSVVVTDQN